MKHISKPVLLASDQQIHVLVTSHVTIKHNFSMNSDLILFHLCLLTISEIVHLRLAVDVQLESAVKLFTRN